MSERKQLRGVCPIVACPFTQTGEVDLESLERLIDFMADKGCDGVTLFGIAGEYYKLSDEESERMLERTVRAAHRRGLPVIASVTRHATELAVRTARHYQDVGADALMLLPPFFLKPGAEALCEHMRQVCRAVDVPVVIQYAPEQTGVTIAPDALASLRRDVPNELYYKIECKPAGGYITAILEATDHAAGVFIGNAGYQFIEGYDRGACGMMPGASMCDLYVDMARRYLRGDREGAMDLHGSVLLPMLNHIRQNPEMIILYEKRILYKRGVIASPYCRAPHFKTDPVFDALFEQLYARTVPYLDRQI